MSIRSNRKAMARMDVTGSPVERNNSKVSKEQIRTEDAPPPGGSYSQAIRSGEFLFISGQTPRNLSRDIVDGTIEEQAQRAFTNLSKVAEAGGATLADAVQVTVYLRDFASFDDMDRVFARFFPEPRPARTTIQTNIPVEVEVDAVLYAGTQEARMEREQ
jgi:2-iminobutanoate/2-iminopropanoate deaminase